ncbi:DCC family protein At1g52590, chloroplastic-like [Vicia villosa]|uniref:DCC family protein At1g52590, chloroplastic-like n=1 Tax=Vicia villosa TaxID=3911 RepID=UPI00273BB122|nr:DCC family protein At1g52590, chloroplastic-like [Vicia villosa]
MEQEVKCIKTKLAVGSCATKKIKLYKKHNIVLVYFYVRSYTKYLHNLSDNLFVSMSLQLQLPLRGCVGRRVKPTTCSPRARRVKTLATLSQPQSDGVNWVEATSSFFEQDKRPIMLFDGVCNLCNGGVKFVRDNDRNKTIRYEALQSEAGKMLLRRSGRAPDDISSVVLVENNRSYIKSEAVLKIMEYIDLPFPQLAFLLHFMPLFVRDFVYDNVANNRYTVFGRSESCEI